MEDRVKIVFTRSNHILARLVRWGTKANVSHVFIEYPSKFWGDRWAIEATTHGGVRTVPAYKARKNICAEFYCNVDIKPGIITLADYFGNKYDWRGSILLGLFVILWAWFKMKIREPWGTTKNQFCSELVSRCFKNVPLDGTEDWEPELIRPDMIYNYCSFYPDYFEYIPRKDA